MQTGILIGFLIVFLSLINIQAQAQSLSAAEAAARAQAETGGRVLKVKPPRSGSVNYRIRVLLPEGRVQNIIVDGNSGETHYKHKPNTKKFDRPFNESPELMRGFNNAPANR